MANEIPQNVDIVNSSQAIYTVEEEPINSNLTCSAIWSFPDEVLTAAVDISMVQ